MVANSTRTGRVTWDELVALEPRLEPVLRDAYKQQDTGAEDYYCANRIFYRWPSLSLSLKGRISRLVGYERRRLGDNEILGSSEAYDVAYETVYAALSDCRNCGCM